MESLFKSLGLSKENGLYITSELKWYGIFPKRIEEYFESQYLPDAFFCIDNKPFILFYNNPKEKNELFRSIWNFNESPVVFIIEANNIEIYNGFKYLKEKSELSPIDAEKKEDFSFFNLITGKTWENYQNDFNYKNRVDFKLLENIKYAHSILVNNYELESNLANRLIGKCIFTRYLIDRKVRIGFSNEHEYLSNIDFADILKDMTLTKSLFSYLQDKFNGDLFNIEDSEYDFNINALVILRNLTLGSSITEHSIQYSLFDIYDFSIIPVEFISNVYELFIGQENQADIGAYYTPVFLVDYILTQTIEKYFKDNPCEYNCKILDPACGSGVFLVEAYRKIIKQYEKLNPEIKDDKKKYKKILVKLAQNNIFGIDKDENAVSVAAFSIYLTMLHFQTPPDIENFKFPPLTKTNFFKGDFFDPEFCKNKNLKELNFIIGNPPWKRGQGTEKNPLYLQYVKNRKKEENSDLEISNKEIAQAFLLRTSDFSSDNTKCVLIITSKILYNIQGERFRNYFLKNYLIDRVFELAAVRREIFDNSHDPAIAPAAILFYRYAHKKDTGTNTLEHIALKPNRLFSMFKVFSIQRNDYKRVLQNRLIDYDYLWKVLVYGSYLDFNFIKRLRDEYQTVGDIISDKEKFLVGTGVQFSSNEREDSKHLIGLNFIKTDDVESFHINIEKPVFFNKEKVHRRRDPILFKSPFLIIKKSLDNNLKSIGAISYTDSVFKDSLTSIKILNSNDISYLVNILSLLQSNLFCYYAVITASSIGIEREQMFNEEKYLFPFVNNSKFLSFTKKIEQLKQSYFEEKKVILSTELNKLQKQIDYSIKKLNEEVLKSFDLSEEENALVDYAVNITIPMIMKHSGYEENVFSPLKSDSDILKCYADIFFNRFEDVLNKLELNLSVEVWHNKNIIGMFFNETPKNNVFKDKITIKSNIETDRFLTKMSSLGINKITDRLFIQKDIRGFEENGFYIIKPNEKKLWHKAIAYLDMYEFADAILKAGRV